MRIFICVLFLFFTGLKAEPVSVIFKINFDKTFEQEDDSTLVKKIKAVIEDKEQFNIVLQDSLIDLKKHSTLDVDSNLVLLENSTLAQCIVLSAGIDSCCQNILNLRATEFATKTLIDSISIKFSLSEADLVQMQTHLRIFLDDLNSKKTHMGYVIPNIAVNVVVGEHQIFDDNRINKFLDIFKANNQQCRYIDYEYFKSLEDEPDTIFKSFNLNSLTFIDIDSVNNYNINISFAADSFVSIHSVPFPFWPKQAGLTDFSFTLDSLCFDTMKQSMADSIMDENCHDESIKSALASTLVFYLDNKISADQDSSFDQNSGLKEQGNYFEKLITLYPDSGLTNAWIAFNYANFLAMNQEHENALNFYKTAHTGFTINDDSVGIALVMYARGKTFNSLKNRDKARENFQGALYFARGFKDSLSMSKIYYQLAVLAELQQDYLNAANHFNSCLALIKKDFPYQAMEIYQHLGIIYRELEDFESSKTFIEKYIEKSRELKSEPGQAKGCFQMGITLADMNQLYDAIQYFRSAIDFMEILGDSAAMVQTDHNIGAAYTRLSEYSNAQQHFEAALIVAKAMSDTSFIIKSIINIGELYAEQLKYDQAQEVFQEAWSLAVDSRKSDYRTQVLYSRGLAHLKEGRLKTGYYEVKEAIELSNGLVHGDADTSRAFLTKLEGLIGEIQDIHSQANGIPQ